jgi:hypothetical protein
MDESISAFTSGNIYPPGEPDDDWTIEELIRWSLDRHRAWATERTAEAIESLRDRCERECEDVMTLHGMAVQIEEEGRRRGEAGGDDERPVGGSGKVEGKVEGKGGGGGKVDEENVDPQRMSLDGPAIGRIVILKKTPDADDVVAHESTAAPGLPASAPPPPPASSPTSSHPTVAVQVTVGPHAPSRFHLRPRPGVPCLVGRSKGKKFVKNGISLHRDQEVSTTHGKFVVVEDDNGGVVAVGGGGGRSRYYFVDVGSTNGTVHEGAPLESNVRLPLVDGMELKVGNSILRIILG